MSELLSYLANTPLPTILCVSGVVFLFLAVSGGLSGKITIPAANQKITALIGVTLLITGISIYFFPKKAEIKQTSGQTTTQTASNSVTKEENKEPVDKPGSLQKKQIMPVNSPAPGKKVNSNTKKAGSNIQFKDFSWQEYGIGFSIPAGFIIKTNTAEQFSAEGDIFSMSIQPWHDASITDPVSVALAAYKTAVGHDKKINSELPLENLNGLKGHVAYVTAQQNGRLTHIYIAGFINQLNETNFTVHLAWYDSTAEENAANEEMAIKILQSFKAIKIKGFGGEWKKMTWDAYGIDFQIPADFKVTKSNNSQFTGTTATLVISIKPFKDSTISDPIKVAQMALDNAPGSEKEVLLEQDLKNLNGFKGYVAYARASFESRQTHMVIAGLLNPLNEANFTVQLMYFNGSEEENKSNMNLCFDILSSFKPRK